MNTNKALGEDNLTNDSDLRITASEQEDAMEETKVPGEWGCVTGDGYLQKCANTPRWWCHDTCPNRVFMATAEMENKVVLEGWRVHRKKPAHEFSLGERIVWDSGYVSSTVESMRLSKSGKSIVFTTRSDLDGIARNRTVRYGTFLPVDE